LRQNIEEEIDAKDTIALVSKTLGQAKQYSKQDELRDLLRKNWVHHRGDERYLHRIFSLRRASSAF
jgi:hypothetical protein